MKPFHLEAAKRGEPIQTRDGMKARFVAHIPEANVCCRVVAMIDGLCMPRLFSEGGAYESARASSTDLVMAPRKVQIWCRAIRAADSDEIFIRYGHSKTSNILNMELPRGEWLDPEPRFHGEYDE